MRIAGHGNKFESNQQTESQSFGIGDPSVVIEILRNRLYEHKIRTCVQEYMSNARDAHREIGQKRRIEVVAPTQLEPTFKVRDYGPGISPDRMANVFVLYGASTKRSNNTQTGGFGIGAKSAWSYADGFIIVSTTDGVKRTYHAHVGASNVGQLDLLETTNTKEPNGCEIQIAVNPKDIREFQESIQRACLFWGKEEFPTVKNLTVRNFDAGYKLNNLSIVSSNELPQNMFDSYDDVLVVDGIAYELSSDMYDKVPELHELREQTKMKLVIRVPNGLVQVSASREKLDDSEFTRKGLSKIGTKLGTEVKKLIADRMDSIKSVKGFIDVYKEMYPYFEMQNIEFEGFNFDGQYLYTKLLGSVTFRGYSLSHKDKVRDFSVKGIPFADLGLIYIKTKAENAVTFNRRCRSALATAKTIYVISERETTVTAKDGTTTQLKFDVAPAKAMKELQSILGNFKDFHAITFVVPPRNPKAQKAARLATQQPIHFLEGFGRTTQNWKIADLIATGKQYVWLPISQWQSQEGKAKYGPLIREYKGDRDKASCRKPIFIAVSEATQSLIEGEANFLPYEIWKDGITLTEDIRIRMMRMKATNGNIINVLTKLDGVKDKFLTKMIDQYNVLNKGRTSRYERDEVPETIVKMFKDDKEYLEFLEKDAELKQLVTDKYPMLRHMSEHMHAELRRELTWYINNK